MNPRREVPVLLDGDITVTSSSHILQYLEEAFPQTHCYQLPLAARTRARHCKRISDTLLDGVLLNVSIWMWAERTDKRPPAMEERARSDLESIYAALEKELAAAGTSSSGRSRSPTSRSFRTCARPSRSASPSIERSIRCTQWLDRMESPPIGRDDVKRLKAFFANIQAQRFERGKIFWRGDRIEWPLAAGLHEWFAREIREGSVLWPQTRLE